ncbi:MerR family transcriptional regulator [Parafrankia sp. Ea1.12]|uniref:MerR family transcriptional regulator n=1 Tax=unclassified Parafrankia TaxID=2994368 RepID=UPI000DA52F18|nr:MerR family transcriptional regulator [Parafrankia sp. BMG5.11]SQD99667.1 hypothetical protein FMEAI12_5510013 [Parafrankia sp. Ea1.12]
MHDVDQWHVSNLSVGQVADRMRIAPSAVRWYADQGLLPCERGPNNERRFVADVLCRVAMIRSAQRVGLTLDEIREALAALTPGVAPTPQDWERLRGPATRDPPRTHRRAVRTSQRTGSRTHRGDQPGRIFACKAQLGPRHIGKSQIVTSAGVHGGPSKFAVFAAPVGRAGCCGISTLARQGTGTFRRRSWRQTGLLTWCTPSANVR